MFLTLASLVVAGVAQATEITIYNQGFALVKENRLLDIKRGRQVLQIEDVASQIDPTSVGFRSLSNPNGLAVLEQNYQFDLISPLAILNKSVGQKVIVRRVVGNGYQSVEGTLLSAPTSMVPDENGNPQAAYNGMVIRGDDGSIILDPVGEVIVKKVPDGLISKPTLLWEVDSDKAGSNELELSYITNGIRWDAAYVLTLASQPGKGDLQGWVTVNNQAGATFTDAKLKLLAGDVNRAPNASPRDMMMKESRAPGGAAGGFQEESLFEYHLYTLQRPATIRQREIKQLALLEGKGLTVNKRLIVDSMMGFGSYYPGEGEVGTGTVRPQVRIEFENSEKNMLGMPLPMGKVRVFQRDKSGSMQMLGEDSIQHTPKNEKVSLVVGRSFDIVAERKRTNFQRISSNAVRETFSIQLRNRKEVADTVTVLERHWGDWRVTAKSDPFEKADANTMQFELPLKANEVRTITYTVETRW